MASYTSWRCTEISIGAAIPNRTLSPRMSTTVMTMWSPMMILSSRCRDRTSIFGSFLLPTRPVTVPDHVARALGYHDGASLAWHGNDTGWSIAVVERIVLRAPGHAVARSGDGPG